MSTRCIKVLNIIPYRQCTLFTLLPPSSSQEECGQFVCCRKLKYSRVQICVFLYIADLQTFKTLFCLFNQVDMLGHIVKVIERECDDLFHNAARIVMSGLQACQISVHSLLLHSNSCTTRINWFVIILLKYTMISLKIHY